MVAAEAHAAPTVPKGTYPEMMKLPPSFPFYPRHLLRYEGVGAISSRRVAAKIGGVFAATFVVFYGIRYILTAGKPPLPTLSEEWQKASEERARKLNSDPISRHKIGQAVADPAEVNKNIREFMKGNKENE